jgi:hypothetical protein
VRHAVPPLTNAGRFEQLSTGDEFARRVSCRIGASRVNRCAGCQALGLAIGVAAGPPSTPQELSAQGVKSAWPNSFTPNWAIVC